MRIWEALGIDSESIALAAKRGDQDAISFIVRAYRPLVASVVNDYREALAAHRHRPIFDEVTDAMSEWGLPIVLEKWDPDRGSFGAYLKNWGRYTIRDELCEWLAATDRLFTFNKHSHILDWPRGPATLAGEYAIPEGFDEWHTSKPVAPGDLFTQPMSGDRDRFALVAASDLATDELTTEAIDALLGPVDRQLVDLAAEGWSDGEIADVLHLHPTTIRRRRKAVCVRLARAAFRAIDERLGIGPLDLAEDTEGTLARLARMTVIPRNGLRSRAPATLEDELIP